MSNVLCRFCGRRQKRAKEHIWPQWLLNLSGLSGAATRETHAGVTGHIVDARQMSYQSFTDGRICRVCNGGWMSEIESASKPIIEKLVAPVGVSDIAVNDENGPALLPFPALTDTERSQLALWTFKTAIVRNAASNYRKIVPTEHFAYLFEQRQIPPDIYVDAGLCPTHVGLSGLQSQTLFGFLRPEDDAQRLQAQLYNIVLAIGPLLLRTIRAPSPAYRVLPNPGSEGRVCRLHPTGTPCTRGIAAYGDYREFELDAFFVNAK